MDEHGSYERTSVIAAVFMLSKMYAMVLEARAAAWAEQSTSRPKDQAGFEKHFCITDQLSIICRGTCKACCLTLSLL